MGDGEIGRQSLLPGIPGEVLFSPVGLICITVTSSFELVVVILQSEGEGGRMEKGGQRSARVPLACRVPPPKQLAGGSSDTHNNHNNGIPRVTRGPPPRIGTALRTAHVTPTNGSQHWLAARRERSHGGLPSLGSTAGPLRSQTADRQDSGPSFRAELRPRNVHTTLPPTRGQKGSYCPAIDRSTNNPSIIAAFTGSPIDDSRIRGSRVQHSNRARVRNDAKGSRWSG